MYHMEIYILYNSKSKQKASENFQKTKNKLNLYLNQYGNRGTIP